MRWQYLGTILQRLNLDHPVRDGVRYHRCRTCGSEWPSEHPGDPANPEWWKCPTGCNADAPTIGGRRRYPRLF